MAEATRTVRSGFLRSAERFPERPALEVSGEVWSYTRLAEQAARIAARARDVAPPNGGPPLTAVFGARSATAYAGVLAALWNGHGYVPLNPSFPVERTRAMLARSGARCVIVDAGARWQSRRCYRARDAGRGRRPGRDAARAVRARARNPERSRTCSSPPAARAHRSAGRVAASRRVVDAGRAPRRARTDRFADLRLTFDLSAFDIFVAWELRVRACRASVKMLPAPHPRRSAHDLVLRRRRAR
jgi:non-ribosomal peptide synthetase component F